MESELHSGFFFFVLYKKLSLFRLFSVTSGTVLSLIIQSPTIQLYSYLSIFLHNFFYPMYDKEVCVLPCEDL